MQTPFKISVAPLRRHCAQSKAIQGFREKQNRGRSPESVRLLSFYRRPAHEWLRNAAMTPQWPIMTCKTTSLSQRQDHAPHAMLHCKNTGFANGSAAINIA